MMKELVLSIIISWIIVKIIKTINQTKKDKGFNWKTLLYDGGMPSSHSVLVSSLATSMFLETGFSHLFIISAVLALIVMWDAQKVRLVTQHQSIALNKLIHEGKKLNEHVGHTPAEVLVGMLFGIIVPIIVYAVV